LTRDGGGRPARQRVAGALLAAGLLFGCRHEPRAAAPANAAPRRVIALAPNLTEIVFALGAGDRLVGVSEYSDFPEAARTIPRVGGLEVDAEKVAALHPDLVLAVAEGNARATVHALEAAGIPVTVTPSGSLDAVLESIRIVAGKLGRSEEGGRLVADLERRRAAVREQVAARTDKPRALLIVWPDPPQAAGAQTFLNDLLTEAGAQNLVGDRKGWPILSVEYLATAPVELLVAPDSPETRPAWDRAFAAGALSRGPIAHARVVRLDESAMTRPGPRVFDTLEKLAGATR
jgi:iron complex transport system substrate-binding protein